jgi:hypothetical protein
MNPLLLFLYLLTFHDVNSLPISKAKIGVAFSALTNVNAFTRVQPLMDIKRKPTVSHFPLHYTNLDNDNDIPPHDFGGNSIPRDTGVFSSSESANKKKVRPNTHRESRKKRTESRKIKEFMDEQYFSFRLHEYSEYPHSYPDANALVNLANNIDFYFTPRQGPNKLITPG